MIFPETSKPCFFFAKFWDGSNYFLGISGVGSAVWYLESDLHFLKNFVLKNICWGNLASPYNLSLLPLRCFLFQLSLFFLLVFAFIISQHSRWMLFEFSILSLLSDYFAVLQAFIFSLYLSLFSRFAIAAVSLTSSDRSLLFLCHPKIFIFSSVCIKWF